MTTCTTASSWRGKRCWLRQVLHSQSLRGYFAKSIRFWPNHFTAIESRMYHWDCEHVWRKPDSELQSGSREGGRWPITQGPRLWPGGSLSCCPCFPAVTSVPNSSPPASSFPPQRTLSSSAPCTCLRASRVLAIKSDSTVFRINSSLLK